ncbi:MAG: alpha/beta hydrolase family protein [Clostridia bacterium]|nr:alpha/beta hydrolase family protein [Clostridia bacterium]
MALLHVDFYSDALGRSTHMDAILPEKSTSPHWKTLYLLHGMTDDHSTWQRRTCIERYAEERGLAVILPDGDLKWYADTPWGERYFEFISRDLIQLTRRMFPRLSHERADTFVAGNSMGGYGALKCALKHPETFSKAASLSGALDAAALPHLPNPLADEAYWEDVFGPIDGIAGSDNDLFAAARACVENRPEIWMWCGTEDFLYDMHLRMREHLTALGYSLDSSESPGDHQWFYWDRELPHMLDWLLEGEARACR